MIHYHGTPITPRTELLKLAGRNFCVSFSAPNDIKICHEIGQSVMLDNGAFSGWTRGQQMDWIAYYQFCEPWLKFHTTWAVIPDVIDGTEEENDELMSQWPHGTKGAPVWHMHESLKRLKWLCDVFPRVCIGSSGQYREVGSKAWHHQMHKVFNFLCPNGSPPTWIHMLRGMSLSGTHYPFASVDSTDIGRNHNRKQNSVVSLANRWDGAQNPATWTKHMEQEDAFVA